MVTLQKKSWRDVCICVHLRADVTRSPEQGYQCPNKKDLCPPKMFKKKKENLKASANN